MTTSAGDIIRNALGLFAGVTVPILGYLAVTAATGDDSERFIGVADVRHQGPGELVAGAMPQVAVMGHRDGPGGTHEVVIQVPGIPGPQSVFVLQDGKTMIAGRLIDSRLSAYSIVPGALQEQVVLDSGQPDLSASSAAITDTPSSEAPPMVGVREATDSEAPSRKPVSSSIPVPNVDLDTGEASSEVASRPHVTVDNTSGSGGVVTKDAAMEPEQTPAVGQIAERSPDASEVQEVTASLDDSLDLTTNRDFQAEMRRLVDEHPTLLNIKSQTGFAAQQNAYYEAVQSLPAISQGDGSKDLYVFFDPNCSICHSLYKELAADVAAGNLVVHWIPSVVFSNKPSSIISSARLISGIRNGDSNMNRELARVMTREGYTDELSRDYVETNNSDLQDLVFSAAIMAVARPETPLLVFLGPDGALNIERGIPAPGLLARMKSTTD